MSALFNRYFFGRQLAAVFGIQPSGLELDEFWAIVNYNRGTRLLPKLIQYMSERRTYAERWVNILVNAPVPIHFVIGPADPVSGKHLAEALKDLLKDKERPEAEKRVVLLPDEVGHYPQTEAPELVLEEFFKFTDSLKAKM
jgi:pimeloyl-ACP methyl ester carboxylesterase